MKTTPYKVENEFILFCRTHLRQHYWLKKQQQKMSDLERNLFHDSQANNMDKLCYMQTMSRMIFSDSIGVFTKIKVS